MFGLKKVVIAQHERGLLFENKSFKRILDPGKYWFRDLFDQINVEIYDLTVPEFNHSRVDFLLQDASELCQRVFQRVELGENEVGLVYKNGKLAGVLPPAARQLYWRGPIDVNVDVMDIATDFAVPFDKVGLIAHARVNTLPAEVINYVHLAEVPDNHVGLLIVDGKLVKTLDPGLHAYWKFSRSVKIETVDRRVQAMDVSGQEILTKDKVSLRVNVTAHYQVTDPVKARSELVKYMDFVYRELQFALRQAVSARTLDTLLGDKDALDTVIHQVVRDKTSAHGIDVRSVGVKDVILPGDMKAILNHVVETEKAAQANVIKRREETAATRSLLNTARLMEDNPVLLRLKELETLEKVTDKVDKLTVFGGLDSLLQDTVKINLKTE